MEKQCDCSIYVSCLETLSFSIPTLIHKMNQTLDRKCLFALRDLILELHYCELGTFPKYINSCTPGDRRSRFSRRGASKFKVDVIFIIVYFEFNIMMKIAHL